MSTKYLTDQVYEKRAFVTLKVDPVDACLLSEIKSINIMRLLEEAASLFQCFCNSLS